MNVAKFVVVLGFAALVPVHAFAQEEIGPLADVVDQQLLQGWQAGVQDGWFVLRNDALEDSEQTLVINAGPPPAAGRQTIVNVSLNSTVSKAAIGLVARSLTTNDVCVMELTAAAAANLFCVIGGKHQPIANVPNGARLDGSDTIEMLELPGSARFYVNDTMIGDVTFASALGGEVGIMAYERGTFGLADFAITNGTPTAATGTGLPPKGGAASGGGLPPKGGAPAPAPEASSGGGNAAPSGTNRMAEIMGPLADTILSAADKEGWQLAYEGNWLVFENPATASSELVYTVPAGPVNSGERVTSLAVGILPPQGQNAADFPKSAAGILIESSDKANSCVGEILGNRDGLVICFGADGKAQEMGRLPGVALGDGQDVLTLIERPGSGEFRLNGQVIAQLQNHPALGGDIGVLAYERGQFYFGGFAIGPDSGSASAPAPASKGSTAQSGPLPLFGNEEARLIGVYLGLTNGIFMHEFGHALIGELQVPSTGPEEDAVDIFSALRVVEPTMYPSGDPALDAIGREVAIYSALPWYYGGQISEQTGAATPWQDEHTGDLKRFRNVFCVIYGGNPGLYSNVAQQVGLEERTLGRCEEEFTRQNRAWRTILAPHTRVGEWHPEGLLPADAPGAGIEVVFEPSRSEVGKFLVTAFGESLRGFADDLAKTYALPRGLKVTYRDCGELNAWYSPNEGSITMCYDLIEHLAVMISDIEMGTEGGMAAAAPAAGTKSSPGASSAAATSNAAAIDELADLGVPATNVLFPAPFRGATPAAHTRATVITTDDLARMLSEGGQWLLIDSSGQDMTIPGAITVTDAGKDGSLTDSFQPIVDSWLAEQTSNNKSLPIVFFGKGLQDRSSYNAALRAGTLGWNALWYRGGSEAWQSNGLPLVPQE